MRRFSWILVPLAGCFAEAPAVLDTDTTNASDGGSTMMAASGSDGTSLDETGEASGDESSATGGACDPPRPDCAVSGDVLWNVELGGELNDAAYALVLDGTEIVFVGEQSTSDSSSNPWFARVALEDGATVWSMVTETGEGVTPLRGASLVSDGEVLAVGSQPSDGLVHGYLEVRDSAGVSTVAPGYLGGDVNHLLRSGPVDAEGVWAVGMSTFGAEVPGSEIPLLLHYLPAANGWQPDYSNVDAGQTLGVDSGALFALDVAPNGNFVAVGYAANGETNDAVIMLFSSGGDLIDGPILFGGDAHDVLSDVEVDDDGSAMAVGIQYVGPGNTAEVLLAHFSVGESIQLGWQHTWGDAAFSGANGFARDGDTMFVAVGTSNDPDLAAPSFDSLVVRWDGEATEPTWAVPYAPDSPGRDYAMDVVLAPDDTVVVCGAASPAGDDVGDAWVRRMKR